MTFIGIDFLQFFSLYNRGTCCRRQIVFARRNIGPVFLQFPATCTGGRTESRIFFLFINSAPEKYSERPATFPLSFPLASEPTRIRWRVEREKARSGQVYNAYHIAGDFRSGRRRQLRVMDRSASQLLIRFTNCLWNLFLVMANVKSAVR